MNEEEDQKTPVNVQQPIIDGSPDVSPKPVSVRTKSSKKTKLVIVAAALFIVFGGGAFAAVYMHMNNKPEKVLADALTNTTADILDGKPARMLGTVSFESKGAEALKVAVKFDSKSSGENSDGSADATVTYAGKTYNLKASAAVFGDSEYYFKIKNLKKTVTDAVTAQPALAMYTSFADPIINKLDNKWVKVTKGDLKQYSGVSEDTIDKCTSAVKNLKLSKSDQKQFKKLFNENQFIVASENLKTEKIEDENSFHYKIDFNNKAAESFTKQVINMESFKTVKTDCEITEKKLEDGFKDSEKATKSEDLKPVVELWVGKASRRPTKFRVSANDKNMTIDFSTQVKLNTTDVKIEKPTDSISINELTAELQKIMPQSTTNLQTL